jgi:hypothetical protein
MEARGFVQRVTELPAPAASERTSSGSSMAASFEISRARDGSENSNEQPQAFNIA